MFNGLGTIRGTGTTLTTNAGTTTTLANGTSFSLNDSLVWENFGTVNYNPSNVPMILISAARRASSTAARVPSMPTVQTTAVSRISRGRGRSPTRGHSTSSQAVQAWLQSIRRLSIPAQWTCSLILWISTRVLLIGMVVN